MENVVVCKNINKEEDLITYKDLVLDNYRKIVIFNDEKIYLTDTEYTILKILLSNRGKIMSGDDLLKRMTGGEYNIRGGNSIAVHIKNIRKKLGDKFNQQKYIKTLWGKGYLVE